jgi:hypothetical protein
MYHTSEKESSIVYLALPLLLRDSSTCREGLCPKTVPVVLLSGDLEPPLELGECFSLSQSEARASLLRRIRDSGTFPLLTRP